MKRVNRPKRGTASNGDADRMFERTLRTPAVHERLRAAIADDDERYLECFIKEGAAAADLTPGSP